MTMITPSYLGETIEYSSLHACRSTLEDPTPNRPVDRRATSPLKANSVPGITHTANPRSSAAAKPRVPVPKSRVTSLSPTFAGRERTLWRLKSHISRTPLLEAPAAHQILARLRSSRITQNLTNSRSGRGGSTPVRQKVPQHCSVGAASLQMTRMQKNSQRWRARNVL